MNEQLLLEILTKFAQHLVDWPKEKIEKKAKDWIRKNLNEDLTIKMSFFESWERVIKQL